MMDITGNERTSMTVETLVSKFQI